jgi:hypothetical protein
MMHKQNAFFYEKQHQKMWWVWLLLLAINAYLIVGVALQLQAEKSIGVHSSNGGASIFACIIVLIISILVLTSSLTLYIDEKGVYVRYFPFHLKFRFFDWNNIDAAYIRRYNPILEFGGWGFRVTKFHLLRARERKGIAYTVSGNMGLQLEMKNGKKILIGTRSGQQIEEVLHNLGKWSE